jgi:antitoxin component of MazEF toxin-antitoxin module
MGYPTKVQLISREKGNQWYVNFPNALAEALQFVKGETVEWTILSTTCLQMKRTVRQTSVRQKKK